MAPLAAQGMSRPPRTWGMRFSRTDAAALAVGACATAALWGASRDLALLVPFTLGHFFLFCNVFRVARKPELVWACVFLANYAGWSLAGRFSWLGVCGVQLPLTAFLLWRETRLPRYHGIFADRWNPRLDEYLRGDAGAPRQA